MPGSFFRQTGSGKFYGTKSGVLLFYCKRNSVCADNFLSDLRADISDAERSAGWSGSPEKANMELKESNEQYKKLYQEYSKKQALLEKSLIDSIPDLVFYKDTNSVYMGCNAAFAKFAGKQRQDIIGLTDRNLFITQKAEAFYQNGCRDAEQKCFAQK